MWVLENTSAVISQAHPQVHWGRTEQLSCPKCFFCFVFGLKHDEHLNRLKGLVDIYLLSFLAPLDGASCLIDVWLSAMGLWTLIMSHQFPPTLRSWFWLIETSEPWSQIPFPHSLRCTDLSLSKSGTQHMCSDTGLSHLGGGFLMGFHPSDLTSGLHTPPPPQAPLPPSLEGRQGSRLGEDSVPCSAPSGRAPPGHEQPGLSSHITPLG